MQGSDLQFSCSCSFQPFLLHAKLKVLCKYLWLKCCIIKRFKNFKYEKFAVFLAVFTASLFLFSFQTFSIEYLSFKVTKQTASEFPFNGKLFQVAFTCPLVKASSLPLTKVRPGHYCFYNQTFTQLKVRQRLVNQQEDRIEGTFLSSSNPQLFKYLVCYFNCFYLFAHKALIDCVPILAGTIVNFRDLLFSQPCFTASLFLQLLDPFQQSICPVNMAKFISWLLLVLLCQQNKVVAKNRSKQTFCFSVAIIVQLHTALQFDIHCQNRAVGG